MLPLHPGTAPKCLQSESPTKWVDFSSWIIKFFRSWIFFRNTTNQVRTWPSLLISRTGAQQPWRKSCSSAGWGLYKLGLWISVFFFFKCMGLILGSIFLFFFVCTGSVAAHGPSLVVASGGYSSLQCAVSSLQWILLLQSTGSRSTGFSSCGTVGSVVVARGL